LNRIKTQIFQESDVVNQIKTHTKIVSQVVATTGLHSSKVVVKINMAKVKIIVVVLS
jgi:hypothetical protein